MPHEDSTYDPNQHMTEKTREFTDSIQRSTPASQSPETDKASEDLARRLSADNSITTKAVSSEAAENFAGEAPA